MEMDFYTTSFGGFSGNTETGNHQMIPYITCLNRGESNISKWKMTTGLVLKLTKYVWFETVTHAQMGQEINLPRPKRQRTELDGRFFTTMENRSNQNSVENGQISQQKCWFGVFWWIKPRKQEVPLPDTRLWSTFGGSEWNLSTLITFIRG